MSDKKRPNSSNSGSMTTDSTSSNILQMPSVTRLLDRKKLKAKGRDTPAANEPKPPAAPQVRAVDSTDRRGSLRLAVYSPESLKTATESEGIVMRALIDYGMNWALFLSREEGQEESYRAASAAGASRERWSLWTGMSLSRGALQGFWKASEGLPSLALQSQQPDQQLLMEALGCSTNEKVWVLRVGPLTHPRGLLFTGGSTKELSLEALRKLELQLSR